MNSRERVMLALSHREPDRVPLELGGAGITSASPEMQKRLRECLGLKAEPDPDFPYFDDALQKHLGIDFRSIHLKGVPGSERRRADGTCSKRENGDRARAHGAKNGIESHLHGLREECRARASHAVAGCVHDRREDRRRCVRQVRAIQEGFHTS